MSTPAAATGASPLARTERAFRLDFASPCFLGNAEQSAQWRTPPLKALLRQWWRIRYWNRLSDGAPEKNLAGMLVAEGKIFGRAADEKEGASARSQVRLRLDSWSAGELSKIPDGQRVKHDEVEKMNPRVPCNVYLAYGPISRSGEGHSQAIGPADASGGPVRLCLSWPRACDGEMNETLMLIQWFGCVGGRSRNGWGSMHLAPADSGPGWPPLTAAAVKPYLRELGACLRLDWPHAVGCDQIGPLVWRAEGFSDWNSAMEFLAEVKIAFRTKLEIGRNDGRAHQRHLLGYPITNHPVKLEVGPRGERWERLAGQIRFKLERKEAGGLSALVFHLPCGLPKALPAHAELSDLKNQAEVWAEVHAALDAETRLKRLP